MFLTILFISCLGYLDAVVLTQPEQIHLSYGTNPSEMVVTWVTMQTTFGSIVEYGVYDHDLSNVAKGVEEVYKDGGSEKRQLYMHRVAMTGLKPGQRYIYHVGSSAGWSDLFSFSAMLSGTDWSPRFAVYGDMGNVNAQSLGRLQEDAQRGLYDAVIHVGDFAYDMDTDNARVGDAFMNQLQSIAAYVPYMTAVGNHEEAYNFANYKNRFTMPGDTTQAMFYSIDIGPIHLVSFSSEFYYFTQYGWNQIIEQYKWLERDLQEANKPESRAARPWLVTMCHRPMYCSNSDDEGEHCTNMENLIRVGIPVDREYGIEDLLYKYGVDIHFQAHEHSYERMWPVYNLTVCNGSRDEPYTNPRAPVHIVTGSAGCQEDIDPFDKIPHQWSAFHSDDYGYTRVKVINATHFYMEQVSDNQLGAVIDKVMVIKSKHGAGLYDCHEDARKQPAPRHLFDTKRKQFQKL